MAAPRDLTHEQIFTLIQQLGKRLVRLERGVRNLVMQSDSFRGSASSGGTSGTGGPGVLSASYSGELESSLSINVMLTSGTGSLSASLPEGKQNYDQ